jgi:hypothetical protein
MFATGSNSIVYRNYTSLLRIEFRMMVQETLKLSPVFLADIYSISLFLCLSTFEPPVVLGDLDLISTHLPFGHSAIRSESPILLVERT